MARNVNIKRMLTGILLGLCGRIFYNQIENAVNLTITTELMESCLCHIDRLCPACEPTKVNMADTTLTKTYKPRGMYEVARWNFLDEQHIFDIINGEPKIELKGVYEEDIKASMEIAIAYINLNHLLSHAWSLKHLQNGYLRSDALQGTDVILDLLVNPTSRNFSNIPAPVVNERIFRVVLRHPLHEIENMKMVSVRKQQSNKIKIIIPAPLVKKTIVLKLQNIISKYLRNIIYQHCICMFHSLLFLCKELYCTIYDINFKYIASTSLSIDLWFDAHRIGPKKLKS